MVSEFGIPTHRQLLKSGIPPREIVTRADGGPLPLAHGDRVIVEVVGSDPTPSQGAHGGLSSAEPASNASLEEDIARRLHSLIAEAQQASSLDSGLRALLSHLKSSDRSVWAYAQENAWLFCRGGLFYAQMQRDVGLVDGRHCQLPLIPEKVFTYNAEHDRLELCFEPHGHFAISRDVEAKIATGQVGSTGQHRESPIASAAPTPAPPDGSTVAKKLDDIATTKKATAAGREVRKGPGFTVLTPPVPNPQEKLVEAVRRDAEEEKRAVEQLQAVVSLLQEVENRVVSEIGRQPSEQKKDDKGPEKMDTD